MEVAMETQTKRTMSSNLKNVPKSKSTLEASQTWLDL